MATKKNFNNNFFSPLSFVAVFGSGIRDPRSGMGKNQDPGSGINIPDPQHCLWLSISRILAILFGCWGAMHACRSSREYFECLEDTDCRDELFLLPERVLDMDRDGGCRGMVFAVEYSMICRGQGFFCRRKIGSSPTLSHDSKLSLFLSFTDGRGEGRRRSQIIDCEKA